VCLQGLALIFTAVFSKLAVIVGYVRADIFSTNLSMPEAGFYEHLKNSKMLQD